MSWLVAQRYSFDLSSGRPGFNPQTCSNYFFYIFQFFSMSFSLLCYFDYSNIDVRNTTKEFVSNFTNDWNIGHLSLKLWAVVSSKGLDNYFRNIPIWTRYDPTINLAYDPSLCYKVFCGYNSNKMCHTSKELPCLQSICWSLDDVWFVKYLSRLTKQHMYKFILVCALKFWPISENLVAAICESYRELTERVKLIRWEK